jgi:hypothetical protein
MPPTVRWSRNGRPTGGLSPGDRTGKTSHRRNRGPDQPGRDQRPRSQLTVGVTLTFDISGKISSIG